MATITKTLSANYKRLDRSLLLSAFSLMGIGLVLVYSASFIFATENYDDGLFFFKRQTLFVGIALFVMWFASRVNVNLIRKSFWILYGVCITLLLATFIPGLAHKAGGATRWIALPGGFHLEPGEITKMMSALIFSWLLTRERKKDEPWYKNILLSVVLVGLPVLLLLKQPDFGSSVLFFLIGLTLLFCFGLPWAYLISALIVSMPLFYILVMRVDYRKKRMLAFLNPWEDPSNSGFQVIQSLLSFNSGGFWGTGLGKGQSKLYFLPEAHTDFILAVLGEETGFLGFLLVTVLFIWLVMRGLQIALLSSDPFAKRLAVGLSAMIGFQAVINIGVVTGLLPTKGLTMPFLSYGGSSLVVVSCACGVLISIYKSSQLSLASKKI